MFAAIFLVKCIINFYFQWVNIMWKYKDRYKFSVSWNHKTKKSQLKQFYNAVLKTEECTLVNWLISKWPWKLSLGLDLCDFLASLHTISWAFSALFAFYFSLIVCAFALDMPLSYQLHTIGVDNQSPRVKIELGVNFTKISGWKNTCTKRG